MPLILASNSASGGYNVANSLRFNFASSDNLSITPASSGNRNTWTLSFWIKKDINGAFRQIFNTSSTGNSNTTLGQIYFDTSDRIVFYLYTAGAEQANVTTTQKFRDLSAWYHIVIAYDDTQATASNRVKLYVNGSQVTAFDATNYPSQNFSGYFNMNQPTFWGKDAQSGGVNFLSGYLSEAYFINAQQLTPSSFGQTDPSVPSSGIWQPKAYTGSFGTNGFYLKFANSAALGTDSSGNGNNFTVNNLTSVDQSTDTCTNNFCTMNPLSNFHNDAAFTDGNNTVDCGGTGSAAITSTIGVSSGKWYAEFKNISGTGGGAVFGIESLSYQTGVTDYVGYNLYSWGYFQQDGTIKNNNSTIATYSTQGNGDICGIALDLTNNKIYFSKNGTWQNSADPSAGTGGISITAPASTNTGLYLFAGSDDNQYAARTFSSNFGSPPYAANSYADGAGFGNFSYAVPSGYYSLCTKNLANFG